MNKTKKIWLWSVLALIVILGVVSYWFFYMKAPRSFNKSPEGIQAIADFYNNNLDVSINKTETYLKNNPKDISGLLLLATSYEQKGSLEFKEKQYGDLAIQTANEVLAIDPNNAEAYRIIGYAYEIEQNYTDAISNYSKSISLDPKSALALESRGHAYYLMGNIDEATSDLNDALKIDPDLGSAWLNLARISYDNGDSDKASGFLSKVSVQDLPVVLQVDYYTISALIKQSAFDIEGASSDLAKALELNPNSPFVITDNAAIKMILLLEGGKVIDGNKINELISDVQKALAIDPNLTLSYVTLGKMKVLTGDAKGSQEEFQKAKEVVPNDITLSASQKKNTLDDIDGLLETQITKTK
ncbi:MAG: tetratricopeptide repeat protein [bacterium]